MTTICEKFNDFFCVNQLIQYCFYPAIIFIMVVYVPNITKWGHKFNIVYWLSLIINLSNIIINSSFEQGTFSDILKVAKIIPMYRNGPQGYFLELLIDINIAVIF